MKKIVLIVVGLVVLVGALVVLLKIKSNQSQEKGVLKIVATPDATVFLDNQSIGKTPYEDKVKPGDYTLKLVPETTVENTVSWESKITVRPNLLTYVERDLKESELTSSGEVLTLEKIAGASAELTVISTPDAANVTIDGKDRDKTPLSIKDLKEGSYDVGVSSVGYAPRSIKVKTTSGYRLTVSFNLASTGEPIPSPDASSSASPSPSGGKSASPGPSSKPSPSSSAKPSTSASHSTPPAKPYVQILDTPTGFLRVRDNPGASGEEVGRVNPNEYYALLDEQSISETPWYKIEYDTGKEGWVSSQYAKKFE